MRGWMQTIECPDLVVSSYDSVLIVDSWSRTCSTKNNKLKPSPLIWAYKHPSLIWGRKTFPNSSRSLITSWNSSQGVKSAARVICEEQLLRQFKLSDDYCPKSPPHSTPIHLNTRPSVWFLSCDYPSKSYCQPKEKVKDLNGKNSTLGLYVVPPPLFLFQLSQPIKLWPNCSLTKIQYLTIEQEYLSGLKLPSLCFSSCLALALLNC